MHWKDTLLHHKQECDEEVWIETKVNEDGAGTSYQVKKLKKSINEQEKKSKIQNESKTVSPAQKIKFDEKAGAEKKIYMTWRFTYKSPRYGTSVEKVL